MKGSFRTKLRQLWVPKPFRLPEPDFSKEQIDLLEDLVQLIRPTLTMAESASKDDRVQMAQFLVDLGTGIWRIRRKIENLGRMPKEIREALYSLESTWMSMSEGGVEIVDHIGTIPDPSEARIIEYRDIPNIVREQVVEAARPTILLNGEVIQVGEVIMGRPISSEQTPKAPEPDIAPSVQSEQEPHEEIVPEAPAPAEAAAVAVHFVELATDEPQRELEPIEPVQAQAAPRELIVPEDSDGPFEAPALPLESFETEPIPAERGPMLFGRTRQLLDADPMQAHTAEEAPSQEEPAAEVETEPHEAAPEPDEPKAAAEIDEPDWEAEPEADSIDSDLNEDEPPAFDAVEAILGRRMAPTELENDIPDSEADGDELESYLVYDESEEPERGAEPEEEEPMGEEDYILDIPQDDEQDSQIEDDSRTYEELEDRAAEIAEASKASVADAPVPEIESRYDDLSADIPLPKRRRGTRGLKKKQEEAEISSQQRKRGRHKKSDSDMEDNVDG